MRNLRFTIRGQSRRIKVESGPCSMIFPDSQIENEKGFLKEPNVLSYTAVIIATETMGGTSALRTSECSPLTASTRRSAGFSHQRLSFAG
jgi:hypothetical protein